MAEKLADEARRLRRSPLSASRSQWAPRALVRREALGRSYRCERALHLGRLIRAVASRHVGLPAR